MKFYIATKLENHLEHNRIRDWLVARGHSVTYDWTPHGPVFRSGLDRISEIACLETNGVREADAVIVLWPGGRGTHVELGIAIGTGIPVVFWSSVEEHHEATQETCAFYHHPLVRRVKDFNGFVVEIERLDQAAVLIPTQDTREAI